MFLLPQHSQSSLGSFKTVCSWQVRIIAVGQLYNKTQNFKQHSQLIKGVLLDFDESFLCMISSPEWLLLSQYCAGPRGDIVYEKSVPHVDNPPLFRQKNKKVHSEDKGVVTPSLYQKHLHNQTTKLGSYNKFIRKVTFVKEKSERRTGAKAFNIVAAKGILTTCTYHLQSNSMT